MLRRLLLSLLMIAPASMAGTQTLSDYYDYELIESSSGSTVDLASAALALADYDVIFLGETHDHPANHRAQYDLFEALAEQGLELSLSLEQFERDTQPLLDQYLAGEIGEDTLMREGRAWENYAASYRPLVELAKDNGWPVIAANAPNALVRCVGATGPDFLKTLPNDIRQQVARELDLSDGAYKTKFYGFAHGASGHGEGADMAAAIANSYAAQVLRDDTMAESIADHISAHPERRVVHLNGSFHSAAFLGTAERVADRTPDARIAVVHPVHVNSVADITEEQKAEGTFLLAIRPPPVAHVSSKERMDAATAIMAFREENPCDF